MAGTRYEYSYTEIATTAQVAFGLYGVAEDVAGAVGLALQGLTTISDVVVKRFTESEEDVTALLSSFGEGAAPAKAKRGK